MFQRSLPLKTLKEAVQGPDTRPFSVCAWVTWFSTVRSSNGSDHYMLLHLSDDSLSAEDMLLVRDPSAERHVDEPPYVTCILFAPQHLLPQFEPADAPRLIYLHQTKVKVYNKEHQLQVRLKPVKTPQDGDTYSIYSMTYEGEGERHPVPTATSHGVGTALHKPVNCERIRNLRQWFTQRAQPTPNQGLQPAASVSPGGTSPQQSGPRGLQAIRELVPPMGADGATPVAGPMSAVTLNCRVLAVDFSYYPDHYVLHVWDNSDAHPVPLTYTSDEAGSGGGSIAAGPPLKRKFYNAGGAGAIGSDCDTTSSLHNRRLHMPLSPIAQFVGDTSSAAVADGGGADGTGDSGSGWEVLSAVVNRQEMPGEGSSVPLVLPAAAFHLAPPGAPSSPPSAAATMPGQPPAATQQAQAQALSSRSYPLPRPGDWIKLINVLPHFVQGQLQLRFSEHSSLHIRPEVDGSTGPQGDRLARLLQGGAGQNCIRAAPQDSRTWLARVCGPWQASPLRTLRQVLAQQEFCDCTPARVLVRVMAVLNPPLPAKAASASAAGAAGSGSGGDSGATGAPVSELRRMLRCAVMPATDLKAQEEVVGTSLDQAGNGLTFALALLLEDATASLRAVVLGGAANLFLWDVPPPDAMIASAPTLKRGQQPHQQQPHLQSNGQSQSHADTTQPTGAEAAKIRGVTTRSRAKVIATIPTADVATAATSTIACAARTPASQAPAAPDSAAMEGRVDHDAGLNGQQLSQQQSCGVDWGKLEKLVAVLHWVSEQRVPGGAWMEAVLRPMYRDRENPWQSTVYSLEHTILQLPPHLRTGTAAGRGNRGQAVKLGSRAY